MDLVDLLIAPVLGAPRMVCWLASKLIEEAEHELLDEGRVRAELLELQIHFDLDEITEDEYEQHEKVLIERLNAIREIKAERAQQQ